MPVPRPDAVFAYCSGMARFALQPPLDSIPLVLDFVDVDSQKWRDMAAASRPPLSWIYAREAATLGAFEARAAKRAVAALVVNGREATVARGLAPDANVRVLNNGIEIARLQPPAAPADSARVVFCGVMNYAPNDEGMQWFVRQVWPFDPAAGPTPRSRLSGSDPTAALKRAVRRRAVDRGHRPGAGCARVAVGIGGGHCPAACRPRRAEQGPRSHRRWTAHRNHRSRGGRTARRRRPRSSVANTPAQFAHHVLALLALHPPSAGRVPFAPT